MGVSVFACFCLESKIHATRLELFAVGDAGYFEITPLPCCPHLDVVGLGAGRAKIAGAKQNHPIVQAQQLQHPLGVGHHFFMLHVTVLGFDDFNQLNLIKLMDANHSARADSRRSRLSSKTRRVGAVTNRQHTLRQNFLAMNVGHGRFSRRDKV